MAVPTQDELSAKLAAKLASLLETRKQDLLGSAGSWPRKLALRAAWPTLIDEVPALTRILLDLVHEEFGKLSVDDLLEYLGRKS